MRFFGKKLSLPAGRKGKKKSALREWVETIVIAIVLALIIRTFVIEVFLIPSGSMEPTLYPHFGSKFLWIFGREGREDWLSDRVIVNKFIYRFRDPSRFEIVVFKFPYTRPGEPQRNYIKRVIGLPSETISVKNGSVYINNIPLEEKHPMFPDNSNYGPMEISEEHYFVMGDNRPNSADSRYWGFLPKEKITGPAFLRIWPPWKIGSIP